MPRLFTIFTVRESEDIRTSTVCVEFYLLIIQARAINCCKVAPRPILIPTILGVVQKTGRRRVIIFGEFNHSGAEILIFMAKLGS